MVLELNFYFDECLEIKGVINFDLSISKKYLRSWKWKPYKLFIASYLWSLYFFLNFKTWFWLLLFNFYAFEALKFIF